LGLALDLNTRSSVRRIAPLIVVFASLCAHQWPAQGQTQKPAASAPTDSSSEDVSLAVAVAEAAIAKSDWKSAQTKLDAWLAAHPSDARALFDAGYVADAQNRLDDAASLYRRAVRANPKSLEARLSLGLLLARQGKLDEARPELVAATELDPGQAGPALKARAWRALAQIDRSADATQASNDLLEALKLSPETPADTLLAANLAESAGQYDAAESAYRRLLSKDPNSVEAQSGLAHVLTLRKQYPEAETLLRSALEHAPDNPALNAQLAALLAAQDKAEALPLLEKLHDAHPENQAITRMLGDVLTQAGDAAAADKLYAALLAANPDDTGLLIAHGQNLTRQLKYPEALAAFDKATKLDPSNGDAWSGLAFAASKTHQPELALHALTMRSKVLPEVPATYFLWATSYDTLHDKASAAVYYHHFLDSSGGKFPDQEWQARQRLLVLEKK
jgi:tetratricopeptide (TPR) repeat protein